MLDTLLAAQKLDNTFNDELIRAEVNTFMFGGHDTTTIALTFVLFNLSIYPDIQEKVFQEINKIHGEILVLILILIDR